MCDRIRVFSLGEEVAIALGFVYEGDEEIESVEAGLRAGRFERGDRIPRRREEGGFWGEVPGVGSTTCYAARLEARIGHRASTGEYRCARLSARDRFDDDWDFADASKLDLIIRVEKVPRRLEVTASDFL